jgi:carboxypeptidase Q
MRKVILSVTLLFSIGFTFAQTQDEMAIKTIFDTELTRGKSYSMLEYLSLTIGQRLSGSAGAATAVTWSKTMMENSGFDTVWLQPVMVPHWVRGQKEIGKVSSKKTAAVSMNICALGGSVSTGANGISAGVIEVKNLDELKALGKKNINGKIVFFNRPMNPSSINTFEAYSAAVDQRVFGASEAAKYGAAGVIVRSMSPNLEDYPHTGMLRYDTTITKIPAVAISTKHAEVLSKLVKDDRSLQFYMETHCEMLADVPSFNVIGELKGSEYKDEIIVVSGHLDSWDLAQGAHDDGAGCVQSIEALRILKVMGYKTKRTIRAVLYMNEENGLRGGTEYARQAALKKEKHIAAIESDEGGFTPRGFSMTASDTIKEKIKRWKPLLENYGLTDFDEDGGGADIGPLEAQGTALIGYLPDSQRYFSYHHTAEDTFDKVNQRELELGAASMTALVYLLDKYGLGTH